MTGYHPTMPSAGGPVPSPRRGPVPPAVEQAFRLTLVHVGIAVVGLIVTLVTLSSARQEVLDRNPGFSRSEVDTAVHIVVAVAVIAVAINAGLYIWLAIKFRQGRNWARITMWVFTGLGVVGMLSSFAQTETGAARVVSVISGLLDIAVIVLLARPGNGPFFNPPPPPAWAPGPYGPPPGPFQQPYVP